MASKRRETKPDNMNIRYTVRVDDGDDKRISNYCKKTGKSRSDVLREALKKHINEED